MPSPNPIHSAALPSGMSHKSHICYPLSNSHDVGLQSPFAVYPLQHGQLDFSKLKLFSHQYLVSVLPWWPVAPDTILKLLVSCSITSMMWSLPDLSNCYFPANMLGSIPSFLLWLWPCNGELKSDRWLCPSVLSILWCYHWPICFLHWTVSTV